MLRLRGRVVPPDTNDSSNKPHRERNPPPQRRAKIAAHKKSAQSEQTYIAVEMAPQLIMMREIQRRAPTRCRPRLLGTSNKQYPRKNTPEPNPNAAELNRRSAFICSPANPTFTRSSHATMYRINRNGINRSVTLRRVTDPMSANCAAANSP